jgi:hypothetical protein
VGLKGDADMIADGWYVCPTCGKHIQKIPSDSIVYGVPFYCRRCKAEWYPAIFNGVECGDDYPFPRLDGIEN